MWYRYVYSGSYYTKPGRFPFFGAIWPVWYESIVLLVSLGYTTKQGRLHALGVGHSHLDTLIPSNDFLFAKKNALEHSLGRTL